MATPKRIKLNGMGDAVFLESAGGDVDQANGRRFLVGAFRLVISGQTSNPVETFGPSGVNAFVSQKENDYLLTECPKIYFQWAPPLWLQEGVVGGISPWLSCSSVWLEQLPKIDSIARISLVDTSTSFVGDATNPEPNKIVFPTRTGLQSESISGDVHPEDPPVNGFFILPFEGGHAVSLGTVRSRVNLSHALAFEVGLKPDDCRLWFRLKSGATSSLGLCAVPKKPGGLFVVGAKGQPGLAMAANPGAKGWSRLLLLPKSLEAIDGHIRISSFEEQDVWLGIIKNIQDTVNDANGIFSPTSRIELDLEVPLSSELTTRLPNARISYNDQSVSVGGTLFAVDRHFGVRVKGLHCTGGQAATLDADFAVFELVGTTTAPTFALKAGDSIGKLLVPKRQMKGAKEVRVLEIPVGDLNIQLSTESRPTSSVMSLETSLGKGYFKIAKPLLVGAPVGITSQNPLSARLSDEGFKRWPLALATGGADLIFTLDDSGIRPKEKNWISRFKTADPSSKYSAIDHPGSSIVIDPPTPVSIRSSTSNFTKFTTKKNSATDHEQQVYKTFFIALSYVVVQGLREGSWSFLDSKNFTIDLQNLDEESNKTFVKEATAKGLQVVYFVTDDNATGAKTGLRKFIDDNRLRSNKPDAEYFLWPFTLGLSVILCTYDKDTKARKYADQIAREKRQIAKPGIGFDMSGLEPFDPAWLQFDSWEALGKQDPILWPRASGRVGTRLDPSDKLWRGVILRDLPLMLPVPDAIGKLVPWVGDLIKSLNKHLMLDFAYRDETGVTWKGGISKDDIPGGLKVETRQSWDAYFQLFIIDASVRGAANAVVSTDISVQVLLPHIKVKNNVGQKEPLALVGSFGIDLDQENPISRIELAQAGAELETESIPGFKTISVRRLVTDFKIAQFNLTLTATEDLAQALPFLSGKPQDALMAFDLTGDPSAVFELSLPAEVETNLFGRWPLNVQSMRVEFKTEIKLTVTGRLNLGLGDLANVGLTLFITRKTNGNLDFDLKLQNLDVGLSLGDMKIKGGLSWGEPQKPSTTPLATVGVEGKNRDMWGYLHLEDSAILGKGEQKTEVLFRSGNKGELNFWVANIISSEKLSLGFGSLENPGFLLSQHADLGGKLEQLSLSPTGTIFKELRPDPKLGSMEWLRKWEPSQKIGTVIAGSGYFSIDKTFIKSPGDPTELKPENLSGILYIDSGIIRIEGVAKIITEEPAHFAIAVDYRPISEGGQKFLVGLQTGNINFGKYTFKPGYLTIGFGFSGNQYLDIRLGWPEPVAGSDYERDWSRALYFHADDLPGPVNTGWGGMKVSYENKTLTAGVAFRCGWTKNTGDVSGGTGGGFDIGYAVGGLVLFGFPIGFTTLDTLPYVLQPKIEVLPQFHDAAAQAELLVFRDLAESALFNLASCENAIRLRGELFGDVWGSAWIRFMGVTLASIELKAFARFRLCGDLNRGMTDARASCGFSVSVKILCTTYTTQARYDIVIINGECCIAGIVLATQELLGPTARASATALRQLPPSGAIE